MIAINDNQASTAKRKRVSKKLKSSWRKHIDIADVDNFLEEQRLTERLGDYGKLTNKELFTLDTSAAPTKLKSKKAKREKLRNAPYKCLALLEPLTKVPDPIAKRNRVRTKDERKNMLITKKERAQRAKGIFKQRDLQRVKDMQLEKQRRETPESKFEFNKDIWSEGSSDFLPRTKTTAEIDATVAQDEWIQGDARRHIMHGPGKMPKTVPKSTHKKPHVLNAIELPHPGMSYNPSYEDHQELLRIIAEKEEKIIKEEKHLERVTRHMFQKVTPAQRDANWMVEMSEGLKPDLSNDIPADEAEYKPINPPVQNKEKSTKQRRVQKEQQKLREQLLLAKIEKKKTSDMYRLKFINKQIERAAKKAKLLQEKRLKKQEYQKLEAKRLGFNKFEEPDLEFNMAKDIKGNLRNLKKEGSLLSDRFKSLQKRNIIAPTVVKSYKKGKVKEYVKAGYQDDTWKKGLSKKLSETL